MLPLVVKKIELLEYVNEDGNSPFEKWFNSLNAKAATKITTALLRVEMGNISNIKWLKGIGEYKINWGPGYRVYLAKVGNKIIILLGGGTKKSQQKDIKKATELFKVYKANKQSKKAKR